MADTLTTGRTCLTGPQRAKLWDWIRERSDLLKASGLSDPVVAAGATKDLGFKVTEAHVRHAKRSLGLRWDVKVRGERTPRRGPGSTDRDRVRSLANEVLKILDEFDSRIGAMERMAGVSKRLPLRNRLSDAFDALLKGHAVYRRMDDGNEVA